jgi:flagellar biosynthesis/type III secretory pathway chaperone
MFEHSEIEQTLLAILRAVEQHTLPAHQAVDEIVSTLAEQKASLLPKQVGMQYLKAVATKLQELLNDAELLKELNAEVMRFVQDNPDPFVNGLSSMPKC